MMEGESQVGPTEEAQASDTVTHGESILFPEPAISWEGNGGSGIIRDRHTKNCRPTQNEINSYFPLTSQTKLL